MCRARSGSVCRQDRDSGVTAMESVNSIGDIHVFTVNVGAGYGAEKRRKRL